MHLRCFCCIEFLCGMGKTTRQSIRSEHFFFFTFFWAPLPALRGQHIFEKRTQNEKQKTWSFWSNQITARYRVSTFLSHTCYISCFCVFIQDGFAQTATLGVSVRSEGGFTTKLQRKWTYAVLCGTCAADLVRKWAYVVPVQRIWSDIEAKVSKCGTCAADSVRMSPYAVPVQRIWSDIEAKVTKCAACAADLVRKSPYALTAQRIWRSRRRGRHPLWGAGKTGIVIESECFTQAAASFVRKPAWRGALKWLYSHFTFTMYFNRMRIYTGCPTRR